VTGRARGGLGALALAAAAALSLAAAPWRGAPPGEVVIGVLGTPDPPATAGASAERQALALVADMVNGHAPGPSGPFYRRLRGLPGVGGGARLRLAFATAAGDPRIARAETERLIGEQRAHALLGFWPPALTAATSEVAERFGVPYLAMAARAPELTRRGFSWFLRASPHDEHLGQALFDCLADVRQRRGMTLATIALARADTPAGADAARLHRALARTYGYRVLVDVAYGSDGVSRAAAARALAQAGADVWVLAGDDPSASPVAGVAREAGDRPRLVLRHGIGPPVEGALSPASFPADRVERDLPARVLAEHYRARTGHDLDEPAALAFTGAVILVEALNRAGSTDPRAIRAALARTAIAPAELVVPWAGVRFDETGQNVGVRPIVVERRGGAVHTVWPFPLATREMAVSAGPGPAAR
jgi:branched-chain amino acid transport system substrate-binding protein